MDLSNPLSTPNTGSAGSMLGGMDAIKQAMLRRGIDASILDQMTPAAAGYQPMAPAPQTNLQTPQGLQPQTPSMPGMPQPMQGPAIGSPEAQMILNALSDRLKHLSKMEKGTQSLQAPMGGLM